MALVFKAARNVAFHLLGQPLLETTVVVLFYLALPSLLLHDLPSELEDRRGSLS